MNIPLKKLIISGILLAMGVLLSILFHALSISGTIFLPLHIPVLLCGFVCGKKYGAVTGAMMPFLTFLITQMPPIYPVAVTMAAELAAYGFVSGLLRNRLDTTPALITAMLAGRIVYGIVWTITLIIEGSTFAPEVYFTDTFVRALPGIAIQLALIPTIMSALKQSGLLGKVKLNG